MATQTDQERLDEALEWAAEKLAQLRTIGVPPRPYHDALKGWVVAVKALREAQKARLATDDWQRKCVKQAHGDSHIRCGKCFLCLERKAISELCDMMLGGSS